MGGRKEERKEGIKVERGRKGRKEGRMDLGWVEKIKLWKDGSGLGQIYQVDLGLIRVGPKK